MEAISGFLSLRENFEMKSSIGIFIEEKLNKKMNKYNKNREIHYIVSHMIMINATHGYNYTISGFLLQGNPFMKKSTLTDVERKKTMIFFKSFSWSI